MDEGHRITDKILANLEKGLLEVYEESYRTIKPKLNEVKGLIEKLSEEEDPVKRLVLQRREQRLTALMNNISKDIKDINILAEKMINGEMLNVYTENINYGAYFLEHESGYILNFDLYNKEIIKKLYKDNENPFTKIALKNIKDKSRIYRDLRRNFAAAIRNGETINQIAKRVQGVVNRNMNDSIRIARTETTRLESIGREEVFKKGQELGLKMKKVWISTSDKRTRETHLMLNGKTIDVDKRFSNGLLYPGEHGGRAEEVINCRCTHIVELQGIKKSANLEKLDNDLQSMTYNEWLNKNSDKSSIINYDKGVSKKEVSKFIKRKSKSDFSNSEDYREYRKLKTNQKQEYKEYIDDKINKDIANKRKYTNIEEAEEKLKNLGVKTVNLEGVDSLFYDDLIKSIEINMNKYPQFIESLNYIGTNEKINETYINTILREKNIKDYMKENNVSNELAEKWVRENMILDNSWDDALIEATHGMTFNSSYFKNYNITLESEYLSFLDGFRVQGTGDMVTTFTHEIGHNLQHSLQQNYNINVNNDIINKILTKYPNSNISEYALINKNEYFAELYADLILSENPSKESLLLEKLLEGVLQ